MPGAKPYSRADTLMNPLARMLPLRRRQMQVYRLAESRPPAGGLEGYGPDWETVSFVLAARGTLQARVNLQRYFTLLALTATSTDDERGGFIPFRAQLYDTKKRLRLADRGVQDVLIGGSGFAGAPMFLREPYVFDAPDSQVLVLVQNMGTVENTIQLTLYGQCLRFNEQNPNAPVFPGGTIPTESLQK